MLLPHLGAAWKLARWIVRNEQDAEDVLQEAFARAFRFGAGFSGHHPRGWLLRIVRNTAYRFLEQNRMRESTPEFDETLHTEACTDARPADSPEVLLLRSTQRRLLSEAVEALPALFREVLVLREAEGLSYKEIGSVVGIPIGTVMSRLSRARRLLQAALRDPDQSWRSA